MASFLHIIQSILESFSWWTLTCDFFLKESNKYLVYCICFDSHTEAGRSEKNSTSLEFLKAVAGYYSVIEREYKKRSKADYKQIQSNIMHISRKFHFIFFFLFDCYCGMGSVSYKFHDYNVPEVFIRTSPMSTVCPCHLLVWELL